jgi:hypothetical protein
VIELEVHNFQSIRHATMSVTGFAAIVGRSNIGKSAVVRAAQMALTGGVGTDFVRHGQECDRKVRGTKKCKCYSKVVIRTQAMELIWEKGDNISCYTVLRPGAEKPDVYKNLDRGTPEFLKEGFLPVKVGDHRELIQIPDQFEPIFLLNKTGTVVADVLSDVARLDNINHAMAEANKDRKDAVSKRRVREEDVTELRRSLSFYDGLDTIEVAPLVALRKKLEDKGRQFSQISGFMSRLAALEATLESLDKALKPEIPEGDALERQGRRLLQVTGFLEDLAEKVPVLRTLMSLDQNVLPDDTTHLEKQTRLFLTDGFLRRLEAIEAVQAKLDFVEQVSVPEGEGLDTSASALWRADRWWKRLDALQIEIAKVPDVVDLPAVETLQQRAQEYEQHYRILDSAKTLAETIKVSQEQMKTLEAEELKVLAELEALGLCPTCDQPVGANHRLHLEAR